MTNADLNYLKRLQERVEKLNSTRKSVKFVIQDNWNTSKDHYDYTIHVVFSGKVSKKSEEKAHTQARLLNNQISRDGYGGN